MCEKKRLFELGERSPFEDGPLLSEMPPSGSRLGYDSDEGDMLSVAGYAFVVFRLNEL